jgi:hypothetical protein
VLTFSHPAVLRGRHERLPRQAGADVGGPDAKDVDRQPARLTPLIHHSAPAIAPINQNRPSTTKTVVRLKITATSANRICPTTAPVRPTPTEAPIPVARRSVGKISEKVGYADTQAQVAKKAATVKATSTRVFDPVAAAPAHPNMLAAIRVEPRLVVVGTQISQELHRRCGNRNVGMTTPCDEAALQ